MQNLEFSLHGCSGPTLAQSDAIFQKQGGGIPDEPNRQHAIHGDSGTKPVAELLAST